LGFTPSPTNNPRDSRIRNVATVAKSNDDRGDTVNNGHSQIMTEENASSRYISINSRI
jgi:hypothetical protein